MAKTKHKMKILNSNPLGTNISAKTVTLFRSDNPLFFGKEHKFATKPWKKKVSLSRNSSTDKHNTLKFVYYRLVFDKKNAGAVEVAFSYQKQNECLYQLLYKYRKQLADCYDKYNGNYILY